MKNPYLQFSTKICPLLSTSSPKLSKWQVTVNKRPSGGSLPPNHFHGFNHRVLDSLRIFGGAARAGQRAINCSSKHPVFRIRDTKICVQAEANFSINYRMYVSIHATFPSSAKTAKTSTYTLTETHLCAKRLQSILNLNRKRGDELTPLDHHRLPWYLLATRNTLIKVANIHFLLVYVCMCTVPVLVNAYTVRELLGFLSQGAKLPFSL